MGKKMKWQEVFDDFCTRFPNLHREAVWWRPHDYMTILIYFEDGRKGTYEGLSRKLVFLQEKWRQ
jgi:hypothetical protein